MARLLLVVGLSLGVAVGSAFGIDWKKYPDTLKKGTILINGGVGFGSALGGSMSVPPISLELDLAMPVGGLPFTFGLFGGYNRSKDEYDWGWLGKYTTVYNGIALAARVGYHPNFGVKKLNPYIALGLGYYIYGGSTTTEIGGNSTTSDALSLSTFFYDFNLGVRYFFGNNIGAFLEAGYSPQSFVRAGLSLKMK